MKNFKSNVLLSPSLLLGMQLSESEFLRLVNDLINFYNVKMCTGFSWICFYICLIINFGLFSSYVDRKGWHHYFKTYCIPEDLIPRFLSPAYFDHYNSAQSPVADVGAASSSNGNQGNGGVKLEGTKLRESQGDKLKENGGEQLVIGVGPVQTPFWRLSRLVPIEGIKRHLMGQKGTETSDKAPSESESAASSLTDNTTAPQSLEIEEGCNGVSLMPISDSDAKAPALDTGRKAPEKSGNNEGDGRAWGRMPSLPSYVPFGEVSA